MKVLIFPTKIASIKAVAARILYEAKANPDCTLGFATGGTVEPVYADIVQRYRAAGVSFAKVKCFNLDEYVGLSPDHDMSYHAYMARHLFEHTDFQSDNIHIPFGNTPDPAAEAERFETSINDIGGIDCQLLGIGENGHIGFNEPTSSLGSTTRLKTLTPGTVSANSRYFDSIDEVPTVSITMGIATILRARSIILLANGQKKAAAVRDMIEGPVSAMCPASALQFHPETEIYLDQESASELRLLDYYQAVHPNGEI